MVLRDWQRGKIPYFVPPPEGPAPRMPELPVLAPTKKGREEKADKEEGKVEVVVQATEKGKQPFVGVSQV